MTTRLANGFNAWLTVYCTSEREPGYVERTIELLESLLPAFQSAVRMRWRFDQHRNVLADTLNALSCAAIVCNDEGRILAENEKLLALSGPAADRARLRGAMEQVGRRLARTWRRGEEPPDQVGRGVETESGTYQVHGMVIVGTGSQSAAAVFAQRVMRRDPSILWQEQFGLTPRETEVAELLLEGRSNDFLAAELEISRYTVENHVRRVLDKLQVKSRAAVPARLTELTDGGESD